MSEAAAVASEIREQLNWLISDEWKKKFVNSKNVQELRTAITNIETIENGLEDAEKKQVWNVGVKNLVIKLEGIFYKVNNTLDEYRTLILKLQIVSKKKKKVCSFPSSPCSYFSRVVPRILDINRTIKKLNEIMEDVIKDMKLYGLASKTNVLLPKVQLTHSSINANEKVVGRDDEKETLVSKLLHESSQEEMGLHIISVVGIPGIGKTTLAQLAYNDNMVEAAFQLRSWVCVSDPFDLIRIAKQILESFSSTATNFVELEVLLQQIRELLREKKFLLVLDDVWTEDKNMWEILKQALEFGAKGSRILVTTRKENVAKMMESNYVLKPEKISKEESLKLFTRREFPGWDEIAQKIAAKCNGIPLAVRTLATLLYFKKTKEEWESVLNSDIWEQGDRAIFPSLTLSYEDLPLAIRRCFSYCALLPKDHAIEVDRLIKLWMAQGFLSKRENMEMEKVGLEYFKELQMRSFFQEITKNDNGSTTCKMEGTLNDFARHLTTDECCFMNVDAGDIGKDYSCNDKARHSTIAVAAQASFPISLSNTEKLRTLLVLSEYTSMDAVSLPDLLCRLASLRALDLSSSSLRKVPTEVGKLIYLRYLNLSYNRDLKELPKAICDLCNLQTLILNGCDDLLKLPQGMQKLISLRHLEILWTTSLSFLPKGIGSLTSLLTLNRFFGRGGGGGSKACNLGDLENLNQLEGYLCLDGLGNVENVSEAKKATLKNKNGLVGLDLWFSGLRSERRTDDIAPKLLEALQPHSNLQYLGIYYYKGSKFPDWLMASTNLIKELILFDCSNFEFLPPLGKLQSLESLEIWDIAKVTKVGGEFLEIDDNTKVAFPKLKKLSFYNMRNWVNWDEIPSEVEVMPSLLSLTIMGCPKLRTLPCEYFHSKLKSLVIKVSHIEEDWTKRYPTSQTSKLMASTSGSKVASD